MKHLFKVLICVFSIALLSVSAANAEESAMNLSWKGNYGESTTALEITFKSKAPYTQQVTAVMYSPDIVDPTFNDYCRMAEVKSLNGEETSFSIKLGNDLSAPGGQYKLTLKGNGYMASQCIETVTVTVLTPNAKNGALQRINEADTENELASELSDVQAALNITLPEDAEALTSLMKEFIKVRESNDYNGSFTSLNDVYDAYIKADIIEYLKSDVVTAEVLREKIEGNDSLFGFNKSNADYLANVDDIYVKVISLKQSYKTTGIATWHLLIQAVEETTCVEIINNCNMDNIAAAVLKYKDLIGISNSTYNDYINLPETSGQKVLRQLYGKSFTTVEEVKTAFENGVKTELEAGSGSTGGTGGSSSGGGSGGGSGVTIGGGGSGNDAPNAGNEVPVVKNDALSDVNNNHWACTYIKNLNETGIISGYPDGTFKPENTVTREEFVKMIVSAAGLYNNAAECDFSDVNQTDWFYTYIASANEAGAVSGITQDTFGVGRPVTRQDVAIIGSRILDKLKGTNKSSLKSATTNFADNDIISEYAIPGVAALVNIGVINGFEDNTFRPGEFLTRAQAAKIIYMIRAEI